MSTSQKDVKHTLFSSRIQSEITSENWDSLVKLLQRKDVNLLNAGVKEDRLKAITALVNNAPNPKQYVEQLVQSRSLNPTELSEVLKIASSDQSKMHVNPGHWELAKYLCIDATASRGLDQDATTRYVVDYINLKAAELDKVSSQQAQKAEPESQKDAQKAEPESQNDAQKAEPESQNDAQKAEPESQNDAQKAEPESQNDAQKAEPISQNDAQKAEPISQNDAQKAESQPTGNTPFDAEPSASEKDIKILEQYKAAAKVIAISLYRIKSFSLKNGIKNPIEFYFNKLNGIKNNPELIKALGLVDKSDSIDRAVRLKEQEIYSVFGQKVVHNKQKHSGLVYNQPKQQSTLELKNQQQNPSTKATKPVPTLAKDKGKESSKHTEPGIQKAASNSTQFKKANPVPSGTKENQQESAIPQDPKIQQTAPHSNQSSERSNSAQADPKEVFKLQAHTVQQTDSNLNQSTEKPSQTSVNNNEVKNHTPLTLSNPESREDIQFINSQIARFRENAKSWFSINNTMKADALEKALQNALNNNVENVRLDPGVQAALAIHRIFSFFGCKSTNATKQNEQSMGQSNMIRLN